MPLETRARKLYNFEVVMALVHYSGAKGCQLPVNETLQKIEALRSSLYRLIKEVDGDLLHPSVVEASRCLDHAITEWQQMQAVPSAEQVQTVPSTQPVEAATPSTRRMTAV